MGRIMTVLGARPQFIKASIVSPQLARFTDEIIVHTGQHFDANMSDVFFDELHLPKPDYFLNIHGGNHGSMTGRMMIELEQTMLKEKPECVLVYGDTNSTLAGALSAAKLHIPIAHIEAGVRSYNRHMPEEINRVVTDQLANFHFVTSSTATENLLKEGISFEKIYEVGDVMYDLALHFNNRINKDDIAIQNLETELENYVLVTIHRAENTDNDSNLRNIFNALMQIKNEAENMEVVVILHPRTEIALRQTDLLGKVEKTLKVIPPVSYIQMANLLKSARLVITDSGGLQKEAYYHKVLCLTLRTETEWNELCQLGWNKLVPPLNSEVITKEFHNMMNMNSKNLSYPMLYGDGTASQKIANILKNVLG